MKNQPKNKYDEMIDELIQWEKKETRKIRMTRLIFIIIGIIFLCCLFTTEQKLICFMGTSIFIPLSTTYGGGKIKNIRNYVNRQIRTIEDEQMRDYLRKQK